MEIVYKEEKKKGLRVSDIFAELKEEEKQKEDILIDPSVIRVNPLSGGLVNIKQGKEFQVTEWSSGQFCKLLNGLPPKYFRESPNYLKAENANYWLEKLQAGENKKIVRIRNDKNMLRGMLSSKYSSFDNVQAVGILQEVLKGRDDYEIIHYSNNDTYLNLKVVFDQKKEVEGDDHKIGFHFSNSEVGARAVRVQSYIYRLICSNGMMVAQSTGAGLKQRHYGVDDQDFYEKVAVAMGTALEVGEQTLEKLIKAKNIPILNVHESIEKISKEYRYNKKIVEEVKKAYEVEPNKTLFGVVQAFTRSAKVFSIEERNRIEMNAGETLIRMVG